MSEVQYITFENGAPRLQLPADYTDDQVRDYLKSDKFQRQMYERGWGYMYGLNPVNLLEEDNLNDNALTAGSKSAVDTLRQIGQGALATMYDVFGAEGKQKEAVQLVKQYQLDQQAHAWRKDAEGNIKPRVSSLEQVFESEQEFSAFLEWLGAKVGEGAVTSVPFVLAGLLTGGVGAGAIGAGLVAKQAGMSALRQSFTSSVLPKAVLDAAGKGFLGSTLAGSTSMSGLGLMAAAYSFGAGDSYVNQLEETDDPNAAIALAAGIPYAAAEGAFGAGSVLLQTMMRNSSSTAVKKALNEAMKSFKKGDVVQITKNIAKATKGQRGKAFGKYMLRTQAGEAVAESLQETITQTAQEVEGGRSLQELYASPDFWKQVGEATAAGFVGGGTFGAIGGTFQAARVGPSMNVNINGSVQNIQLPEIDTDMETDPELWEPLNFGVGDTVTYTGAEQLQQNNDNMDGGNFDQPNANSNATRSYIVGGTANFNGNKYIALIGKDTNTEIFVPLADANKVLNLNQKVEVDSKEGFSDESPDNINLNQDGVEEEYKNNLDIIKKRGYNINKDEIGINNESKKKWVNASANTILSRRAIREQLKDTWNAWVNKGRPDMRNSEGDESLFYDIDTGEEKASLDDVIADHIAYQLPGEFEQYAPFMSDEKELRKQLTKTGWAQEKNRRVRDHANNLYNYLSPEERDKLNQLGYDTPAGQEFLNELQGKSKYNRQTSITNPADDRLLTQNEYYLDKGRGRKTIKKLIKDGITFEDAKAQGYYDVKEQTKEKVKRETPLEISRRTSIIEDRIGPSSIEEIRTSLLGEGLYSMSVVDRLNAIRDLISDLDTKENLRWHNGLEKSLIATLKKEIAKAKKAGLDERYMAQQLLLENVLNQTYVLPTTGGVIGSFSENARIAIEIKLEKLKNKTNKTAVDDQYIALYTEHIENIQTKRENLNKLLSTFNIEPVLTNKEWNNFDGKKLIRELQKLNDEYTVNTTPSPVATNWMKANQGKAEPRLTENFARNAPKVLQTLKEIVAGMGLDIQVDLAPFLTDNDGNIIAARYLVGSKLVEVAFNGVPQLARKNVNKQDAYNFLLYHEVMHALRTQGFFKQHEWLALNETAKNTWMKRYSIAERYSELSYDEQIEEAIAEAFADYMTGRSVTGGPIAHAFERLKQFLIALANALTQNKFDKPSAIFKAVDLGIVGKRYESMQRGTMIYTGGINASKIVVNRPWSGENFGMGNDLVPFTRTWFSKQTKITNLPQFFKWWNSAGRPSSVVDANGAPLVVMHTTKTFEKGIPFTEFNIGKSKDIGMHFTATQRHIDYIQQYNGLDVGQSWYTFKGFLNIKNPYRMPDLRTWKAEEVIQVLFDDGIVTREQGQKLLNDNPPVEIELEEEIRIDDSNFYQAVVKVLQDQGYDGIVYKNFGEDRLAQRAAMRPEGEIPINPADVLEENNNPPQDSWIAFESNQFKSVLNDGGYDISQPNMFASRQFQPTQGGWSWDRGQPLNRQERRSVERKVMAAKQGVDKSVEEGANLGGENLSWFSRWVGSMREWAGDNLPMAKLFTTIRMMEDKMKQIQMLLSNQLSLYNILLTQDPVASIAIRKAQAISQWYQTQNQGTKFFKDSNGQIIFRAPVDYKGGPADLDIKPGEVVILEGDVADAFLNYDAVMDKAVAEIRKGLVAGVYAEPLREALEIINKFYGQQIRLSTDQIENLNATDVKNIIIELRRISDILEFQNNVPYGPLTPEQLAMLIPTGELTKQEIKRIRTLAGFTAQGKPNLKAKNSLGNLLQELNKFEQWAQGTYVPLMRFGPYFIKVTNPNIPKTLPAKRTDPGAYKDEAGKYVINNPEYLLDYQQFESKSDADKALTDIKIKYSDVEGAVVSNVQKQSLKELKDQIKQRAMGLAGIGQYLSESSAKTFKELEAELNQIIAMNNGVTGFDAFMTPRSRQGGVPGYSSDFARAAEQFIYMASRTAARNRFMPEVNRKRNAVIADAQDRGDKKLEEGVKTFYEYSLDPAQEFAQLRRIGFWWYLGGNLSSAFLQIFSAIQFTGPMIAEMTPGAIGVSGAKATAQLGRAFKDATNMFSFTENQYGDALIDWTKAPPDVIEAIMQDLGTYLKVGMAMQEAGQVPGTETLSSQRARLLRQFENLIIGGAFNSMEAISRLTGYIATYRTMASDPAALDRARTLFEGNQLFQEAINQNGGVLTPQIVARHVVDDTFGVYGKLNRPAIMRKWGSVPALFQTYIIQMFALMNRMLLKGKTPGQKAAGRRVFARMVLMIVLTGGLFGLPGSDDAEDFASWIMENVPGVGSGLKTDVRAELREMLYDAGFGPGLINAMENGLIETFLNVDIQRRIALGNAPGSQQVRAITSLLGLSSGGNPADFAGAPGSVFMTPIKEAATAYREGRGLLEVAAKSSPLFIRNAYKAYQQSMGKGFVETNFGTVTVDDATMMESIKQAMGFGSARMKREREAAYMERFYSTRSGKVKKRFNAQITNAYRDILIGNKKGDSDLVLDAQQRIQDLTRELYKWNSKQKPADMIFVELDRLWDEAYLAANQAWRQYKLPMNTYAKSKKFRQMYGLK